MNGFLNLLKPPGMTSHDVVQHVRRTLRTKSVGHTGTLDPAAAGVLVLTVGYATRLGEYLLEGDKAYRAEVTLGVRTDTADAEGQVIAEASAAGVNLAAVEAALGALTGTLTMRPPAHSAIRVAGKRLYDRVRAGEQVEAPERVVEISELRLLEFLPGDRALLRLDVACSKGTYIRSLAEMIGERLGCGGMLSLLIRTRVGAHRLDQATSLERLAEDHEACLLEPRAALPHLPVVNVGAGDSAALRHGQAPLLHGALPPGPALVYDESDQLLCLAEVSGEDVPHLKPRKVFAT